MFQLKINLMFLLFVKPTLCNILCAILLYLIPYEQKIPITILLSILSISTLFFLERDPYNCMYHYSYCIYAWVVYLHQVLNMFPNKSFLASVLVVQLMTVVVTYLYNRNHNTLVFTQRLLALQSGCPGH